MLIPELYVGGGGGGGGADPGGGGGEYTETVVDVVDVAVIVDVPPAMAAALKLLKVFPVAGGLIAKTMPIWQ